MPRLETPQPSLTSCSMYINLRKFKEFYVSVRILLSTLGGLFLHFSVSYFKDSFWGSLLFMSMNLWYECNTNFIYNWKNECTIRVLATLLHVKKIFANPPRLFKPPCLLKRWELWTMTKSFEKHGERLQFSN